LLLFKKEFRGGVVLFKEGKDPADMIKNGEENELKAMLTKPIPFTNFIATTYTKRYNLKSPQEKQSAINEIKTYVKDLSPVFKEEFLRECARIFNVSESFFSTKKRADEGLVTTKKEDILELKIIKTILENDHYLDTVLNYVEPSVFRTHRDLFDSLLQDLQSPILQGLLLNDTIQVLDEEELQQNLRTLMIVSTEEKLKGVMKENIPFAEKTYLIKKYQLAIKDLKSGRWITE